MHRYVVDGTRQLIEPLVAAGHQVDAYVFLGSYGYQNWDFRTNAPPPELLNGTTGKLLAPDEVQGRIRAALSSYGANVRACELLGAVPLDAGDMHFVR